MRRYRFLTKDGVYSALNKLRSAFLAAKDGKDVDEILNLILSYDERMKIGRRIQIAQMLVAGASYRDIKTKLKVGTPTIILVDRSKRRFPKGLQLIENRENKVINESGRSLSSIGGSKLIKKPKVLIHVSKSGVVR